MYKKINCKKKGKRYEAKIAKLISNAWRVKAYKTPNSGAYTSNNNVSQAMKKAALGDVVIEGFPVVVECKDYAGLKILNWFHKKPTVNNIYPWWVKLCKEAEEFNCVPLLIMHESGTPSTVLMNRSTYGAFIDNFGVFTEYIKLSSKTKTWSSLYAVAFDEFLSLDKNQVYATFTEIIRELYYS